nr:hypothetical protein [Tanacetum cinerariifolium]
TNLSVLVDKTKSARDGLKTAHTELGTNEESRSDKISNNIKLEDLSNLMQDSRFAFFTPDSLEDEPIIVLDESEKEETERYKDTHATSHDKPKDTLVLHPPSPKSVQIQEFATSVENASSKVTDKSVPSAGQANASPAEGEKNTKDVDIANLKQQPTTTTPPKTSSFQSPLFPMRKGKKLCLLKMLKKKRVKVILTMIMPIQLTLWLNPLSKRS